MASEKQISNVKQFQKKNQWNIGSILFALIFAYLLIIMVKYITAPRITPYEVRQGSILKDNGYTGLAIRDEMIVCADAGGYINYYIPDNSKVRTGTNIYTLSDETLNHKEQDSAESVELSEEERKTLLLKMQSFGGSFEDSVFYDTYLFRNELETTLQTIASKTKLNRLDTVMNDTTLKNTAVYPSVEDGILVYYVDGMEEITVDSVKPEDLERENYKKTEFRDNVKINAGQPIYKLITNEMWTLVTEITDETAEELQEKNAVRVRFDKDNQMLSAAFEIKEVAGRLLLYLSFDDCMIRYANERYLDIELILEDQSGLKIPKSAKTTKEFYDVPKNYLTEEKGRQGVFQQIRDKNNKLVTEFVPVNIYFEKEESVYLDAAVLKNCEILIKPDSEETYLLRKKEKLNGVYYINKGYAVFKPIQILCESEEYYIIEEGNEYGLSNYDRIALDSEKIKEDDIVF